MPKYREGEDLLDYIKRIEKRLETMERTSQLANSSIENGALAVNINDGQTQTMQIGVQFDGTSAPVVLVSPTPPAPSTPIAGPALNGITVSWDGTFVGAALTPMDFAYVAVHVGAPGFDPFLTTPVHVFNSPQGGKVFVPIAPATYEVRLITRTLAGTPSVASAAASGTAGSSVSDGSAPGASPVPVAVGGVGSFFVSWTAVANNDPVTYDVYAGTASGFTADSSSIIGTTDATTLNVRTLNGGVPFSFDTNYYFKIRARDADGSAAASAASNAAQMVKITNEYVAASYVYAGEIFANQLRSGTMTADIAIAGSFSTAASGQRSVMDGLGFRQYGPDGVAVITDIPNTGNPMFTGIVNAFGLIVNGGLEFRGQNNLFAMGSVVTLATTTAGSTIAPNITPNWQQLDSGVSSFLLGLRGYHRESDGALPTHVVNFFGYSSIIHNGFRYNWPEITDINGQKRSTRNVQGSTMIRTAGGQRYVVWAGQVAAGGADVWKYELLNLAPMTADGIAPTSVFSANIVGNPPSYVISHSMGRCLSPVGSSALENQFATAEMNIFTTQDTITFRRFACTDSSITQQGSNLVVNSPMPTDVGSNGAVVYGSSGKMGFPGAEQNVWVFFGDTKAYVWDATGTRLPDFDFPIPSGQIGIANGSTAAGANGFNRFESTTYSGNGITTPQVPTTRYENIHWASPDSSVWWVSYTWNDSNGTTHESDMSAIASTTMPKRMRYTLTAPNLPDPATGAGTARGPDDVNGVRFYMARQATLPTRTQMWKQTTQPADLATSITYTTLPQFSGTTNPPLTTNFPAQAASKFQSSAIGADGLPKVLITGDGQLHGEALDVSGLGSAALSGKAFEQLYYSVRSQALLTGGGVLTVSSTFEVKWSAPFRPSSLGRSANLATAGYFEISTPTASTVVNGYGGATNKTVTANGIPLADWDALYYVLPYGSTFTSQNGNFRVVNLSSDFVVPNDWVLICIKNGTSSRIEFTTGDRVPASAIGGGSVFQGPIACSYGSGFTYASDSVNDPPFVYAEGNWAYVSGRVRRSSGTGLTAFVIPAGYRPRSEIIRAYLTVFALGGGNAEGPTFVGDIDPTNGNVDLRNTTTVAWTTSTWLSIFGAYPRTLS